MLGRCPSEVFDFFRNFSDYERLRENRYRQVANRRDWLGQVVSASPPVRWGNVDAVRYC